MADYDNRIKVELPLEIEYIRTIWMNTDEHSSLAIYRADLSGPNFDHLVPGYLTSSKLVIRINDDLSWTAFRGSFSDPADTITKHGLLLDEDVARKLFGVFSSKYPYPYRFHA